jgi:hypothetical protein
LSSRDGSLTGPFARPKRADFTAQGDFAARVKLATMDKLIARAATGRW